MWYTDKDSERDENFKSTLAQKAVVYTMKGTAKLDTRYRFSSVGYSSIPLIRFHDKP